MLTFDDFELLTQDEFDDLIYDHETFDYQAKAVSYEIHDINKDIEWNGYLRTDFDAYVTLTEHGYQYAILVHYGID